MRKTTRKRPDTLLWSSAFFLLGLLSCSDNATNPDISHPSSSSTSSHRVVILTTDYDVSGVVKTLDSTGKALSSDALSVWDDCRLAAWGNELMILERYQADNLIHVPVDDLQKTAVDYQVALTDNDNPMDIAFVSKTEAWVALGNQPYLIEVNPQTGDFGDSIDLSSLNPKDNTHPSIQYLERKGDSLLVSLQRLDASYSATGPGLIAVVDISSRKLLDTINLKLMQAEAMVLNGDDLYVACSGYLMNPSPDSTRGLVHVSLSDKKVSVVAYGSALGGAPTELAIDTANGLLYTAVQQTWPSTGVVSVSMDDGKVTKLPDLLEAGGGIAYDPVQEVLYIGERNTDKAGIKIWDGSKMTSVDWKDNMPPSDILITDW